MRVCERERECERVSERELHKLCTKDTAVSRKGLPAVGCTAMWSVWCYCSNFISVVVVVVAVMMMMMMMKMMVCHREEGQTGRNADQGDSAPSQGGASQDICTRHGGGGHQQFWSLNGSVESKVVTNSGVFPACHVTIVR
jgi:hypothetical protein